MSAIHQSLLAAQIDAAANDTNVLELAREQLSACLMGLRSLHRLSIETTNGSAVMRTLIASIEKARDNLPDEIEVQP